MVEADSTFTAMADVTAVDIEYTQSIDGALTSLEKRLPSRYRVVGWSLGGMLALRLALRSPQRVLGVVTLASNARFVASATWPWAMSTVDFEQFHGHWRQQSPALAQRHFLTLQVYGDSRIRQQRRWLQTCSVPADNPSLLTGLRWLADFDNREAMAAVTCPVLYCFGARDYLVPASAESAVKRYCRPQQMTKLLPHLRAPASRPPHTYTPRITGFFRTLMSSVIDKTKIARSFSRSAAGYDAVAHLQRKMGARLLSLSPAANVLPSAGACVDLGCGTGFFREALEQRYAGQMYLGLDIAEGMLSHQRRQSVYSPVTAVPLVCGDAEQLPLANHSATLLFANLTLQWCAHLRKLLVEAQRVLMPGGYLCFSTLGPETLIELKQAWAQVDDGVHVNHFFNPCGIGCRRSRQRGFR